MSLRPTCRHALRQLHPRLSPSSSTRALSTTTKPSSISQILSKPSWSVKSLLSPPQQHQQPSDTITPTQLSHLLRLSALPLPSSPSLQSSMIQTLQSQLQFVRAVQGVNTTNIQTLSSIRDETEQGTAEAAVTLDSLRDLLDSEVLVGHYARPKRVVREKEHNEAEDWDALGTAKRKAGRFFVVQSKKAAE